MLTEYETNVLDDLLARSGPSRHDLLILIGVDLESSDVRTAFKASDCRWRPAMAHIRDLVGAADDQGYTDLISHVGAV